MDQTPRFAGMICRGSLHLGTACGHCERCQYEKQRPSPPPDLKLDDLLESLGKAAWKTDEIAFNRIKASIQRYVYALQGV